VTKMIDRIISAEDIETLAKRLVQDLDHRSPDIGVTGPPDRSGPDIAYVDAINDMLWGLSNVGEAINTILTEEADAILSTGKVARPNLLYNLAKLLQSARVPYVVEGLHQIRIYKKPLREAIPEEDLFAELMFAHALNQSPNDYIFWDGLLDSSEVADIRLGILGIYFSAGKEIFRYLPMIEEKYKLYPKLGDFVENMRLMTDLVRELGKPEIEFAAQIGRSDTGRSVNADFVCCPANSAWPSN